MTDWGPINFTRRFLFYRTRKLYWGLHVASGMNQ